MKNEKRIAGMKVIADADSVGNCVLRVKVVLAAPSFMSEMSPGELMKRVATEIASELARKIMQKDGVFIYEHFQRSDTYAVRAGVVVLAPDEYLAMRSACYEQGRVAGMAGMPFHGFGRECFTPASNPARTAEPPATSATAATTARP